MKVLFGNHKHAIGMIANFFMSKTTLIKNTKGNKEQERKKRE